jgi:anti-anti-sigma regulatory factor
MTTSINPAGMQTLQSVELVEEVCPGTVVLQPYGGLSGMNGMTFQANLQKAIAQAEAVIVDLLWIDTIDQTGITIFLSAMKQAHSLGKSLSFLAMDTATRIALDKVWEQQQTAASAQADWFTPEFERFLDNYKKVRK